MNKKGTHYQYNEETTWNDVEQQVGSPELVLELLDELEQLKERYKLKIKRKAFYSITNEIVDITGLNENGTFDALFINGNTIEIDKSSFEFL